MQQETAIAQFEANVEAGIPAAVVIRPVTTKFKAVKREGYGYGNGYKEFGVIGEFDTKEEASEAARKFTRSMMRQNCPDCYQYGAVVSVEAAAAEAQALTIQAIVDEAISANHNMSAAELLADLSDEQLADGIIEDMPRLGFPERDDVIRAVADFRARFQAEQAKKHTYLVIGLWDDGTRWADSYTDCTDTAEAEAQALVDYPGVKIAGVVELENGVMHVVA